MTTNNGGAQERIIVMILSALMLTMYPHGVVAEVDPACAAPAPSAAVEQLYFSGPAAAFSYRGDFCGSGFCGCVGGVTSGFACVADGSRCGNPAMQCVSAFVRCAAQRASNVSMQIARLQALAAGRGALNTTVLFHSCVYTACVLGGVAGNCSSGAADFHARAAACTVGLRFLYRTRTATLPLTWAPLVPMPVPGQLTAQQFTLETSLPVSAGTKAQLDTALQRFARDQVSSVLADPSAEPRQVSVNVDTVPLTAPHYWLATVSAAVLGGKISAMELAGLLASRCADAVPQTAAQPPAFAALGLRSSAGPDYAVIDFPVLEDSATAEDEGLLPLWAIALGSVISVGFGVVLGAVLSRMVCRAVPPPSLAERLALDATTDDSTTNL
jgi:hypothetical protein